MKFVTFGGYHTSLLFEAICMDFYSIEGFPGGFIILPDLFVHLGKRTQIELRCEGEETQEILIYVSFCKEL